MIFRYIYGYFWLNLWLMINTDSLQISPEILNIIAEIDEFKGAWKALGNLAPEQIM